MLENIVFTRKIKDNCVYCYDSTQKQNIWVSADFNLKIDWTALNSEMETEPVQWKLFKKRVETLHTDGKVTRVAIGPVIRPKAKRNGTAPLIYQTKDHKALPTHYFASITQEGKKEIYLLPTQAARQPRKLEVLKTTQKKIEKLAGMVFGPEASDVKKKPQPKAYVELKKKDFKILYCGRTKQPCFTVQTLTKESIEGKTKRTDFYIDDSLPQIFRVTNKDYYKSGFHKGHMVAAEDCKSSVKKSKDSFALSNASPQYPKCNKSTWRRTETFTHKKVRQFPSRNDKLKVISAPIFQPDKGKTIVRTQMIGESQVTVPTHYIKVLSHRQWSCAWLIPNTNDKCQGKTEAFLKKQEITLTEARKLSGIDFTLLL